MQYAFVNGVILDGTKDMKPITGKAVLTDGDRITAITSDLASIQGYEVIDLNGAYIMPGLINLHVHIPGNGKPKKKPVDAQKVVDIITANKATKKLGYELTSKYVLPALYSGVTTIRSVGGVLDFDSKLRDDIAKGKKKGPRIFASNMAVSVPNGHAAGYLAYIAHSADEAVELVRKIAADGPDLIKLMITGGVYDATVKGEPGVVRMPEEYVKAACDEAHKLGFQVAAHVESPEGVKIALRNGVDTIEHGAKPDEEMMALFRETGAALVTTISPALPFAFFDNDILEVTEVQKYNGKVVFDGIVDCAKACMDAGVTVGLGTDTGCPYTTHYDMWRELNYFHKYCSASNSLALHTATLVNAGIIGMDKEIGSVEPGKCADLIVTKENPLDDLQALRNVSMVIAKGEIVDISGLKKYPKCEKELDKYL